MSRTSLINWEEYYPTILEACKIIAYDNGAVNRLTTEEEVVGRMLTKIERFHTHWYSLTRIEVELYSLSKEDLETACIGEQGSIKISRRLSYVLDLLFEGMM